MVGLGNPGKAYAYNRHNLGFLALQTIAKTHALKSKKTFLCEGFLADIPVVALFPTTFMNQSGEAVARAVKILTPQKIIVFQDELDLVAGKCRMRHGGGAAGHNGIKSIQKHIGSDFIRVRLGIGRPACADITSYVLENFSKHDDVWLKPLLSAIGTYAPLLAQGHFDTFANRVHLAVDKNGV